MVEKASSIVYKKCDKSNDAIYKASIYKGRQEGNHQRGTIEERDEMLCGTLAPIVGGVAMWIVKQKIHGHLYLLCKIPEFFYTWELKSWLMMQFKSFAKPMLCLIQK